MEVARVEGEAFRQGWTWRTRVWLATVGWLVAFVLRLVYATLRVRLVDPHGVFAARAAGTRIIAVFWHEGLVLTPLIVSRLRWPGTVTALLSRHRDAEIAAQTLSRLGIKTVRGSANRGRLGAVRGHLAAERRGDDVVIVPDGPRGPRRVAKDGIVHLARVTGLPLVAFGATAWPARRLGSWDRLQLPRPFARVALVASAPVAVARDADAAAQDAALAAVQAALDAVTREADAMVGAPVA